MKQIRIDPAYKEKENMANKLNMKQKRLNFALKKKENLKEKLRKQLKRQKLSCKRKDQKYNRLYMSLKRRTNSYRKRELRKTLYRRTKQKENSVLKFREAFTSSLQKSSSRSSALKLKFIAARKETPKYSCDFCDGLFFKHSVKTFDNTNLNFDLNENAMNLIKESSLKRSGLVCYTCFSYLKRGKLPKLAAFNGLKFVDVPPSVSSLSPLEERMVAPYINFMQIRPLKPFALNPQLGLKGSVVNIPVEVNDMVQVLPRKFNNMATIQIKLKRHVDHSTDYMFETVRPTKIKEALQ